MGSKFGDVYYCEMNSADSPAKTFLMAEYSAEVSPATIKAGGGNDTIFGGERENLYVYNAGDGNDVIYNVGTADTLSISGGSYTRLIKNNDLIIKVGNYSITLKEVATKTISIIGEEETHEPYWTFSDNIATYRTENEILFNVIGVKSLEGISLNGKTVTISKASLKDSTVEISTTEGYMLALSSDVKGVKTTPAGWSINSSIATYKTASTSEGYVLDGNKINYIAPSGGETLFTLSGVNNTTGIKVDLVNKNVTLPTNNSTVTITSNSGYTLNFADGSSSSGSSSSSGNSSSSSGASKDKNSSDSTTLTVTNKTSSPVTIGSSVKNVNASSRTSAVKITGNSQNNSILGGSGADTLAGAAGNDTLTGGDGNDVFIYSVGKDVIADYATGDKISLGAAVSKATLSGSDVIFTIGSGSLTVKNAKGKSLAMIDSAGKSFSTILGGSTTSTLMTVTNSTKSPVTVGSDIKTINASSRTTAVKINGNSLANSISGGSKNDSLYGAAGNDSILGNAGNDKLYGQDGNDILKGGAGNDSLWGGKGNDSLWGDAGNDTFLYSNGDGKDVIYGFENNDLLQITGTFSAAYNKSKKEIAFKVGSAASAITLKDFSATSFNINGDSYKISGTKLVKK